MVANYHISYQILYLFYTDPNPKVSQFLLLNRNFLTTPDPHSILLQIGIQIFGSGFINKPKIFYKNFKGTGELELNDDLYHMFLLFRIRKGKTFLFSNVWILL
jgi:hypothetical protein